MLVAIFIFSLAMITVVFIFSKIVVAQKKAKAIQQNMEDARYAMEVMAKTLRTSSISSVNSANATTVDSYDYSQDRCIRYKLAVNKIQMGFVSPGFPGDKSTCNFGNINITNTSDLINKYIGALSFNYTQSTSSVMGKVTISMKICSDEACSSDNDSQILQTTVSLRDYSEVSPQ